MDRTTLGIILAAGKSSRLFPATLACTKQVVPVYDKPLIYYALTTLISAGIRDIVLITNPDEQTVFKKLLDGAGQQFGVNLHFAVQPKPRGIAQAFTIVADQVDGYDQFERVALILGDNLFHGSKFDIELQLARKSKNAVCFATPVQDPERFGVVELDSNGRVLSLEEKPKSPKSNLAVTGLYFYPPSVFDIAANLKKSNRGEYEITDVNKEYAAREELFVTVLDEGIVWFDTGNAPSLLQAAEYVHIMQTTQNVLIGSPHLAAFKNEWIAAEDLAVTAQLCDKTPYGQYLWKLIR